MPTTLNRATRLKIKTTTRCELIDITDRIAAEVRRQSVTEGIAYLHNPHTTAGLCINENADPDVKHDLLKKLETLIPKGEAYYRHAEGNSDSHLKAILTGVALPIQIEAGRLVLGRWQGIYFCEFDGPRERELVVRILDATPPQLS